MDASLDLRTRSPEETRAVAAAIAKRLRAGDVVALLGELGSGKTCFVEGAARALGYAGRVRSPSFTLLNIYRGRQTIYHLDLYRWSDEDADGLAEWEELLDDDGVSFIEWAEHLGAALPARALVVRFEHAGASERVLRVSAPTALRAELREGLLAWMER